MQLNSLELTIPARPEVLGEIDRLLARDADFSLIAQVIERDIALASAVVKAVNSPFYGVMGRAKTVQQAIAYIGALEVRRITQALALARAFPDAPHLSELWARSSRRAHVANRLARYCRTDTDMAHTAGLFLEAGIAVMSQLPGYTTVLKGAAAKVELEGAEAAAFGMTHTAVGRTLCERWGVADEVAAAVGHGACLSPKEPLEALLLLSDSILSGDLSSTDRFAAQFGCSPDELRSTAARLASVQG